MNLISEQLHEQKNSAGKMPYEKPGITTFGSVAKLTQGKNGTKHDVGQNNSTRKGGV